MENYPGNPSFAKKGGNPTPKKVESVITNPAKRNKARVSTRLKEGLIGGDDIRSVSEGVFWDVLLPAFRSTISTSLKEGVDRIFGAGTSQLVNRVSTGIPGQFKYNTTSAVVKPAQTPVKRPQSVDSIILETKVEADTVLESMWLMLGEYTEVTVADFYTLVNIDSNPQDHRWGWRDLRGLNVVRTSEGYRLDVPTPRPLER